MFWVQGTLAIRLKEKNTGKTKGLDISNEVSETPVLKRPGKEIRAKSKQQRGETLNQDQGSLVIRR